MKSEILVIDDNADIRFLICKILQEKGYNIRPAANYNQAVAEINTKLPNLAIIDIKLDKGDKDGIDLLKLIIASILFCLIPKLLSLFYYFYHFVLFI